MFFSIVGFGWVLFFCQHLSHAHVLLSPHTLTCRTFWILFLYQSTLIFSRRQRYLEPTLICRASWLICKHKCSHGNQIWYVYWRCAIALMVTTIFYLIYTFDLTFCSLRVVNSIHIIDKPCILCDAWQHSMHHWMNEPRGQYCWMLIETKQFGRKMLCSC